MKREKTHIAQEAQLSPGKTRYSL